MFKCMTKARFDEVVTECYPDLVCGDNNRGKCVDCKNITTLDITSAEAYVMANISPKLSCCRPCSYNVEYLIEKAVVYRVLATKMYNPEEDPKIVDRQTNDLLYSMGLVTFG